MPESTSGKLQGHREKLEKQSNGTSRRDSVHRLETSLQRAISIASDQDVPPAPVSSEEFREQGDEIYDRYSLHRKIAITAVMSLCSLLAPLASTTVLSAIPEVAAEFNTSGSMIGLSNALYMLFMGLCAVSWGPLGTVFGRRNPCLLSAVLFLAFSIGTALAPNLAAFFIFRILTAYQGTSFLMIGASIIRDIWKPTSRATAIGWFYSGTLIGPAFGPLIGSILVTFGSWRNLFWLQTALAGTAVVAIAIFVPETAHQKRSDELRGLPRKEQAKKLWAWTNPWRFLSLFRYPPFVIISLVSSSLVWNMYSLFTPIRYVLNPRFDLTTPLQSGLFYLAPGCGYLVGTVFGGPWADRTVKRWIRRRNGERVPEDRLRSCTLAMSVVIPACMLLYGWSIETETGGVPLPVVVLFVQGVAQLFCFPSLNTYCVEVLSTRSSEVIGGNYLVRYFFAALGSAVCLPAIEAVGIGWFSTVSALFVFCSSIGLYLTTWYGRKWRDDVDRRGLERKQRQGANESPNEASIENHGQSDEKLERESV